MYKIEEGTPDSDLSSSCNAPHISLLANKHILYQLAWSNNIFSQNIICAPTKIENYDILRDHPSACAARSSSRNILKSKSNQTEHAKIPFFILIAVDVIVGYAFHSLPQYNDIEPLSQTFNKAIKTLQAKYTFFFRKHMRLDSTTLVYYTGLGHICLRLRCN